MIRSSAKIYGEVNNPDTVLATTELVTNKFIVGDGNKGIKVAEIGPNAMLISNEDGTVTGLDLLPNKAIGTDEFGDIVLLDR